MTKLEYFDAKRNKPRSPNKMGRAVQCLLKTQIFSRNRENFRLITSRSSRTTRCAFCMKKV